MKQTFNIKGRTITADITSSIPTAKKYTPAFFKNFSVLKNVSVSFSNNNISFYREQDSFYIKIRQKTEITGKEPVYGDVFLSFSSEDDMLFFITNGQADSKEGFIIERIVQTEPVQDSWVPEEYVNGVNTWWQSLNQNKNIFSPDNTPQTVNYGRAERNDLPETRGKNNHNPISYYDTDKITWDRDLKNIIIADGTFNISLPDNKQVKWDASLENLTNGAQMFKNSKSLSSFTSDLNKMSIQEGMFEGCCTMTLFSASLPETFVNGTDMFKNCKSLEVFKDTSLGSLTNGKGMFEKTKLNTTSVSSISNSIKDVSEDIKNIDTQDEDTNFYTVIDIGVSNYSDSSTYIEELKQKGWTVRAYDENGCLNMAGIGTWEDCTSVNDILTTDASILQKENVSERLSHVIDTQELFTSPISPLFDAPNIYKFAAELDSLTNAGNMFNCCSNLRFFEGEKMDSLELAFGMFYGCQNLTHFRGSLTSLSDGRDMFYGCRLDKKSLYHIANGIKQWQSGSHLITIGLGCSNVEYSDEWEDIVRQIIDKGWSVIVQYNG